MKERKEYAKRDIHWSLKGIYIVLRITIFLVMIPSLCMAFLTTLYFFFDIFLPDQGITVKNTSMMVVSLAAGLFFIWLFRKVNLITYREVLVSEEVAIEIDSENLANLSKAMLLSSISWLLPITIFGYAFLSEYPDTSAWGSFLLGGSVFMMILMFETGRKLRELKKWSWNSSMLLSFMTCFNIPFGSITGLNSIRVLQKSKHYFECRPNKADLDNA